MLAAARAGISSSQVVAAAPAAFFADDFNRGNAVLNDRGWVPYSTAVFRISNQTAVLNNTGGGYGVFGSTIMHPTGGSDIDFTVKNFRLTTSGTSYLIVGCNPTTVTGAAWRYDSSVSYSAQIDGAGSVLGGNQQSSAWTGGTALLRMTYKRSTRLFEIYYNGSKFSSITVPGTTDMSGTYIGMSSNVTGVESWDDVVIA